MRQWQLFLSLMLFLIVVSSFMIMLMVSPSPHLNGSLYVWYNDSPFTFRADVIKTDWSVGSTAVSPGWCRPVEHRGTSSSVRSWLHAANIDLPLSAQSKSMHSNEGTKGRGRQTQNNNNNNSHSTRLFPGVFWTISVLRATRSTRLVMSWSRAATENRNGPTWHSTGSVTKFSKPGFLFLFFKALFVSARVKF